LLDLISQCSHNFISSNYSKVNGLRGLVELVELTVCGRVDLEQCVDAADAEARHQLPRRQALELSAQVCDGAEVTEAGVVGHRVGLEGRLRRRPREVGKVVLVDDLLVEVAVVVDGVDPVVGELGPVQPALQLVVARLDDDERVVVEDGVEGAGAGQGAVPAVGAAALRGAGGRVPENLRRADIRVEGRRPRGVRLV